MLKFKEHLSEVNVSWSRNYTGVPDWYIIASTKEANLIFDAMIKFIRKQDNTLEHISIEELAIPSSLKKKYRGVVIRGTFMFSKYHLNKAGDFSQFFKPNKFKNTDSILDLDPSIDFEVASKKNETLIKASAARDRFTEAWMRFKQQLHKQTIYKNIQGKIVPNIIAMGVAAGAALRSYLWY